MKHLTMLLTLLSLPTWATPHKIEYSSNDSSIQISTEHCIYGRGVQEPLKAASFSKLRQFIDRNQPSILAEINAQHRLKPKQLEYISLLLKMKLTSDALEHKFSLSGNDTCTSAYATLNVDPNFDYALMFDYEPPKTLHFTSPPAHAASYVGQRLAGFDIKLAPRQIAETLVQLGTFKQQGQTQGYYKFPLQAYLTAVRAATSTIYIHGNEQVTRVLNGYLGAKNFTVVSDPSAAYWKIDVTAEIDREQFISLTLDINNKDEKQFTLTNNSRALPAADMNERAMFEKYTKVHFELMKLVERLK